MTLTQLHYMTAVAEYGNFTLAADKCFVTQPTPVSYTHLSCRRYAVCRSRWSPCH